MAKNDITNVRRFTIDAAHTYTDRTKTTLLQRGGNIGHAISTDMRRLLHSITCDSKHVQFKCKPTFATFYDKYKATMLTYDSGADGHYLSKKDKIKWDYQYCTSTPRKWVSQMAEHAMVSTSPNCHFRSSPTKQQKYKHSKNFRHH